LAYKRRAQGHTHRESGLTERLRESEAGRRLFLVAYTTPTARNNPHTQAKEIEEVSISI